MTNIIMDERTGKIIVETPLPPFRCLTLEGGGVRGTAYVGLAKKLEQYGMLADIAEVAGSSAGAIAALIIALGYKGDEARKLLCDLPLEKFLEGSKSWSMTPEIISQGWNAIKVLMKENHSLSSGKQFLTWLEELVEAKLGKKDATFADLYHAVNQNKTNTDEYVFKNLYVTGTDISLEKPECKIFSYETTPNMPIALAVRASSSFPFIFKPVEWDGHQYIDGGVIKNLPAKIFDEKKFIPTGYSATDKLVNPGTLIVKVDSEKEIDQIIWGINNVINLKSAADIAGAICSAISETVDISEIRESRLVIPLEDGEIKTLEFAIDADKKSKLIKAAEITTQEFLENHANEAYSVKCYDNIKAWLDDQTIDELVNLLAEYVKLFHQLSQTDENPTQDEVKEYVVFLKKYLLARIDIKINPEKSQEIEFPKKHINLKIQPFKKDWGDLVIKEMKTKLENTKEEIEYIKHYIDVNYHEFQSIKDVSILTKLHANPFFDRMKQYVHLKDYLKILNANKQDLEIKLNIDDREKYIPDESNSIHYQKFSKTINQYKTLKEISPSFKAILDKTNLYHPQMIYRSTNETDNTDFILDLRDSFDRKLYCIAMRIYLKHKQSKDYDMFKSAYDIFYPEDSHLDFDYDQNLPNENIAIVSQIVDQKLESNMQTLSTMLGQCLGETLMSAYRIEELLHVFEQQECPKTKPTIDIDKLFGKQYSEFQIKENNTKENSGVKETSGYALKQMYPKKTTSLVEHSMFYESKKDNMPNNVANEKCYPKWFM